MSAQSRESYKWVVLAVSFFLMFTFAISLQALPPIFASIMQDVPFSNAQAGTLMGAYAIPGIFLPFLVAFLAKRFKQKTLVIFALVVVIVGLIAFSQAGSFSSLLVFRVLAGSGATILLVLAPLLVAQTFDQKNMGIAMGIFNTAVPLGTVVAANFFGALAALVAWRLLMLGIAALAGIVLVISSFALTAASSEAPAAAEGDTTQAQTRCGLNLNLWLLALVWALANLQMIAYVTFAPQYFQDTGLAAPRAAFFTSFIMLVPVILSPLVGMLIDRTGRKKELLFAGSLLMAVAFVLLSRAMPSLALWAFTLGIGFAPIAVIVFSLLPEVVAAEQVGLGLGILTAAANLGLTIGPAAFGMLLDVTAGNFDLGLIALALVSLIILALVGGLKAKTA